ncbi:MAG: hypothetical protein AAF329_00380 [Cyanobacteria bacterium P01_A01_bin.17]
MWHPLQKDSAAEKPASEHKSMKVYAINQVLIVAILCATAILLTAIMIGFPGAIDIRCGGEGCRLRLESDPQQLPPSGNVSDDAL